MIDDSFNAYFLYVSKRKRQRQREREKERERERECVCVKERWMSKRECLKVSKVGERTRQTEAEVAAKGKGIVKTK